MLLHDLVTTSRNVAGTTKRLEKIALLAALLRGLDRSEVEIGVGFLIGWPRQGRLGIGWATVEALRETSAAETPSLSLTDVDRAFDEIKRTRGGRSVQQRRERLSALFRASTTVEQRFLSTLLMGEVRQGALEGVLLDAVARATDVPNDE